MDEINCYYCKREIKSRKELLVFYKAIKDFWDYLFVSGIMRTTHKKCLISLRKIGVAVVEIDLNKLKFHTTVNYFNLIGLLVLFLILPIFPFMVVSTSSTFTGWGCQTS